MTKFEAYVPENAESSSTAAAMRALQLLPPAEGRIYSSMPRNLRSSACQRTPCRHELGAALPVLASARVQTAT